ncbi:MAG: hypothetical protein QM808_16915 [Steroidobacteraceae bacterium]
MRAIQLAISFVLLFGLSACEPSKEAPPAKPPTPAANTVFAPTVSTLDKARSVEGTLQQGKDNADTALKAAE